MIFDFNTLRWYSVKGNRQYDNTENRSVVHHFETNKIPSFQLVIDSTITTATYKLYDVEDTEISSGSVTVEHDTNENDVDYSRLIFLGTTLSGKDDGFYYIEVTHDGTPLYSDVFCWQTDVSDYLKIVATSSDMSINDFSLNLTGFTYLVYLEAFDFTEDYEIEEEGSEKTYGVTTLFSSRNHSQTFDITGYRATEGFLAGLRTVQSNGVVTLTFKGEEFEIYDIEAPEKKSNYNNTDIIIIGFKFKKADYLQTRNTI